MPDKNVNFELGALNLVLDADFQTVTGSTGQGRTPKQSTKNQAQSSD
jgi:hypothetical protein